MSEKRMNFHDYDIQTSREQTTICEMCGNRNLAHDRAVWTEDGSSFCPPCYPREKEPTP